MLILEVKNVSKLYKPNVVLEEIDIEICKGQIFGLLGPNGAGKTSLIRIINQIIFPDQGQILFKGQKLAARHTHQIGYLPEERGLYKKMKVEEQLLYLGQLKGLSRKQAKGNLEEWIEKFGIETWLNKKIDALSKGMQQKIQFIATVLHQPEFIILDEPFTGFDPVNTNLIKKEILDLAQKGSTIMLSTHRMENVEELCTHIALINKSKKILSGEKELLKQKYKRNTFSLVTKGALSIDDPMFDILETQILQSGHYQYSLIFKNENLNDLITLVMKNVEIKRLEEKLPTINDIFIELVSQ